MKIVLEVEDKSYQTILDFISLLPENQCRVLPEETNKINLPDNTKDKPFTHKYSHQVLPTGTTLLVALTIRPGPILSGDLKSHLKLRNEYKLGIVFSESKLSVNTQFIEVTVGGPTAQKQLKDTAGGVFIQFDGLRQTGILTSSIKLPIKDKGRDNEKVADSLNYAFTCLSEEYEPWRKSHTGNIYDKIFYRESNNKWYPIDVLRNNLFVNEDEHPLVFEAQQEAVKTIEKWESLNRRQSDFDM